MDREEIFRELHELTEFCRARRGRCFAGWSREKLFFYLGFHRMAGTLFVVREGGGGSGQVTAVAVAFLARPEQVLAHDEREPYFNWKLPERGCALVIFDVIGKRALAGRLLRMALAQWPGVKRFFTWRRERLKEISAETMQVFANEKLKIKKGFRLKVPGFRKSAIHNPASIIAGRS